jgi:hypothetical protein
MLTIILLDGKLSYFFVKYYSNTIYSQLLLGFLACILTKNGYVAKSDHVLA